MKRRLLVLAASAWIAALGAPVAIAAPSCADPGGIGGTGVRAEGGTGGTGVRAEGGTGGTGVRAEGGTGGTGVRAEGGTGGTGVRAEGGTGGTGVRAEGGTGGTGVRADGGIGGTGVHADIDLGLIGVITGFGSICVNGVEVHYDATTPVAVNGQPASTGALALGQTVAIRAVGGAVEARAHAISVIDAVIGPVTAVDSQGEAIQILGQRIRLGPSTVLGSGLNRQALGQAATDETLRVSGLRTADGTIVATRVERAPSGVALAYGPVSRDAAGAPQIGGLRIDMRGSEMPRSAGADESVLVAGHAQDGKLVVERVVTDPHSAALAPGRFVVQGYVTALRAERELHAGGVKFSVDAELGARLERDRLVRVSGRSGADGTRIVERIEFLAEPMNPRPQGAAERASSRGGEDDRRGRGESESGDDGRRGSGSDGSGSGDSSGRSGPSDRPDRSGSSDRPDRPETRGRR